MTLASLTLSLLSLTTVAAEPPLVGGQFDLIRTPSANDAWGGPRTGQEPTLSQRVVDYDLHAVLDPKAHTVDGNGTILWRNRSNQPISALYAHLYLNAFESEGSIFLTEGRLGGNDDEAAIEKGEWGYIELRKVEQQGKPVRWTFVHPDGGPDTDHTVVRLDLPTPVPPGGQTELQVAFFDQLPRVIARTGYFDSFHLVAQWFPKIGVLELPGERGATEPRWNCHAFHNHSEFYADFGSYSLEAIVPEGFTVGASGLPTQPPEKKADGVHHRYHVDDVHDVVFTAWDHYAAPLTGKTNVPGGGEVEVEVLYPPEYEVSGQAALTATLDALRYYSTVLGPYPYPHVTVIVPPFNATKAGGMEYETFFTTIGLRTPVVNAIAATRFVTIHEFAHGYFMGLLASNEFEEPFLDEGMNEWSDARMMNGEKLQLAFPTPLAQLGFTVLPTDYWVSGIGGGRPRDPADPIASSSWAKWSDNTYSQVYSRTLTSLHDLEIQIGPELTAKMLRTYYARWHHRHPSAADLREAYVEAGADRAVVEHWFETQVYGAASIDDRIEEVHSDTQLPELGIQLDGGTRVALEEDARDEQAKKTEQAWEKEHGKQKDEAAGPFPCHTEVGVRRYGAAVPRTLELTFKDGTSEKIDWPVNERWKRVVVDRPTCLAIAKIDVGGQYFLDMSFLDDQYQTKTAMRAAATLTASTTDWLQVVYSLLEAL